MALAAKDCHTLLNKPASILDHVLLNSILRLPNNKWWLHVFPYAKLLAYITLPTTVADVGNGFRWGKIDHWWKLHQERGSRTINFISLPPQLDFGWLTRFFICCTALIWVVSVGRFCLNSYCWFLKVFICEAVLWKVQARLWKVISKYNFFILSKE